MGAHPGSSHPAECSIIDLTTAYADESEPLTESLTEPLTNKNVDKAFAVHSILSDEDRCFEAELPVILEEEPSFLIGLRVRAIVDKPFLFSYNMRGCVTDMMMEDGRIYLIVTWDNLPQAEDYIPEQRAVRFTSDNLFKYCRCAFE